MLCVIYEGDGSHFSQVISIYLQDGLTGPSLLEGGSKIAKFVQTAMLLPNDDTANRSAFCTSPRTSSAA